LSFDKIMNSQTVSQTRSSWWSITAYNDDIQLLNDMVSGTHEFPSFVREIYGGEEECPTTGRVHFQGALHTTQVRFGAVKKIFPNSHIEGLKSNAECLKAYVMKDETAVGEKRKATNQNFITIDGLMMMIASEFLKIHDIWDANRIGSLYDEKDCGFWSLTKPIVMKKPFLANLCSQPQSIRCWIHYCEVFIQLAYDQREETSSAIVLPDDV